MKYFLLVNFVENNNNLHVGWMLDTPFVVTYEKVLPILSNNRKEGMHNECNLKKF